MNSTQYQQYIDNNTEALKELSRILEEANKIKGRYDKYSIESRQLAINLVEDWMKEIFSNAFTLKDLPPVDYQEETGVYWRLNKKHRQGGDDF